MQKDNPFFVRLFGDTSEMTRSQIKTLLDQAKQLRDYLKTTDSDNIGSILNIPADTLRRIKESPEALKALQDAVDKLTKKRDENSFDKLFSDIEKGLNKIKLGGKANIGEGNRRYWKRLTFDYACTKRVWAGLGKYIWR